MLDRLRKRFGDLLGPKDAPVLEEELQSALNEEVHDVLDGDDSAESPGSKGNPIEQHMLSRKEAQKREARLILTERIHNRAAGLIGGLKTDLLHEIHSRLEKEVRQQSLHDLLQVTLDTGFTTGLDSFIDGLLEGLLSRVAEEFKDDPEAENLLPDPRTFAEELKAYRDSILKKHLLEQVEVLALPTSAHAFPLTEGGPAELKERLTEYWASCRDALDKFFRSVEMVLLDGARDGIRIESDVIRQRLVAAQYRNGYRLLEDRFRALFGELAKIHMSANPDEKKKIALDRRVVDEVIVPLAYFIRERSEPEPREALVSRAELLSEIVDKLVVSEPFQQTAEAVKPVLRKSVEQARPIASQSFPYLAVQLQSLNPNAIHRTTALLKVFESLVCPDLDEHLLAEVEQVIRLNREQFRLYQALERSNEDLIAKLEPLDRIADEDARFLAELMEQAEPTRELVEDLCFSFGYTSLPDPLPASPKALMRLVATFALLPKELVSWSSLYMADGPTPDNRARLARLLVDRITPSGVGADLRQSRLGAKPLPIDLGKALAAMDYKVDDPHRARTFTDYVKKSVESGEPGPLGDVIYRLQRLRETVEQERIIAGVTSAEASPYVVEIWLTEEGRMVGLVNFHRRGFGYSPIELIARDDGTENRKELESKLRRQLQNQALIYKSFFQLFEHRELLSKDKRRALPAFVKKLYEPVEANRVLLLARLRYSREILVYMETFAKLIVASDPSSQEYGKNVLQILGGLVRKVADLTRSVDKSRDPAELVRLTMEYERALKYLNTVVVHSVNPWLERQTGDMGKEFVYNKMEVEATVRAHTERHGLDWERDVEGFEAHVIRGTLGCRALVRLVDGSSKVLLLNYDRRQQDWVVRHMGPRLTDVVRHALLQYHKELPADYDEKFEQPTFSLDEQTCRFLWVKRNVARVEATLVLDTSDERNPWRIVYLKYNDQVLEDRLSS